MSLRPTSRRLRSAAGSDGISERDLPNSTEVEQTVDKRTPAAMGKNVQSRSKSTLERGFIIHGPLTGIRAESSVYSRRS